MEWYHHVRLLKQQHAEVVNAAPLGVVHRRPVLSWDTCTHLPTPQAPSKAGTTPASKILVSNSKVELEIVRNDSSDYQLVENYLYRLSTQQLDEIGVSIREVQLAFLIFIAIS